MRISIMQPYFLPYAGYFRLMHGVDVFVVYDIAQFPRAGWVHRNRLRRTDGGLDWLTLPLARAPLDTSIGGMAFHPQADRLWRERWKKFPACRAPVGDATRVAEQAFGLTGPVVEYLCRTLKTAAGLLGFDVPFVRASSLAIPALPDRLERLAAICRELGATEYVNSPGGRELYDPREFARFGIEVRFLPPYRGEETSILQRLQDEPVAAIRREIDANLG